MTVAELISRLDGARQTGRARWIARCPAHADRSPSLAVSEKADGRILIHCFAGCATSDVLSSLELAFGDLFSDRLGDHFPRDRRPYPASDALRCFADEAELIALAADNLANGVALTNDDRARLRLASVRIRCVQDQAHG